MSKRSLTYGLKPVIEALEVAPGAARKLLLSKTRKRDLDRLLSLAEEVGLSVEYLSPQDLNALCGGGKHQGVALEGRSFEYTPLDHVLGDLQGEPDALVVILDQVQDPMNLGSIARSAVACGAKALIVPERRAAPVTASVIKASAGQILRLKVCKVTNLSRAIEQLKEESFWIAGAATRGGKSPWEVDLKGRLGLVMGSEGRGMRRLTEEACDHALTLPLIEGVESLGVSAASAMMLYECVRQRRG